MTSTFYRDVYNKIKPETTIEEKEQIMYDALIKTDRIFTRNIREGDLYNSYGSETAHKFLQQIKKEENELGRRLTSIEIENKYQEILGSLKKWKQ
jgi:hypothetical protein